MDEFLTIEQVAKLLQVSKMTIYRYIKAKKLKAYKIGKEFRIEKSNIDNFLNSVSTK